MNKRIKKKKLKQQLTQEEALERLAQKLAEAILQIKREYSLLCCAEESSRLCAEAIVRHFEQNYKQNEEIPADY